MSEDQSVENSGEPDQEPATDGEGGDDQTAFDLKEKLSSFDSWDALAFNDRLYSEDENQQRDGNYLVDVSIDHDDAIVGPRFNVGATAEGRINGLRWTLKLTACLAAKTLETLTQTLVEEVEAGPEEDAGMIIKTTTIEAVRGSSSGDKEDQDAAEGDEGGGGEEGEEGSSAKEETEEGGEGAIQSTEQPAQLQPIISYKIAKTTKHGEEENLEEKNLTESELENFISEGANILLLRLLIKCDFCSNSFSLQMKTIDPNLNLTPAIYAKIDNQKETISGTEVILSGIERVIICPDDVKVTTNSLFLPSAHLAIRQQIGSPTVVKIDSLPVIGEPSIPEEEEEVEEKEEEKKPEFEKKELNWEEDMMLFSKYLDRKEELKASHLTYIRHHPELKCLLADFLQQLLLRKPEQVLPFAESFFSSFSLS